MGWKKEKETFRLNLCSDQFETVRGAIEQLREVHRKKPALIDDLFREKEPGLAKLFSPTYRRVSVSHDGSLTWPEWLHSAPHASFVAIWALCVLVSDGTCDCPQKLMVDDDALVALPPEINRLNGLTSLSLKGNSLRSLPPQICELTLLTDLSVTALSVLPENIGHLKSLCTLKIRQGELTHIPIGIGNLERLTDLDLSANRLVELPVEIERCVSLKKLNLSMNPFTELSDVFAGLKRLTELNVSDCPLKALPNSFASLSRLQSLNILNTDVRVWPMGSFRSDSFYRFKQGQPEFIIKVECSQDMNQALSDLQFQAICDSAEEGSQQMRRLNRLKLHNRGIRSIPRNIDALRHLEVLDLSNNQISALPNSLFRLRRISTLNLSGNQLSSFLGDPSDMGALVHLDLSDNRLADVPELLGHLPALKELNLQWNPLRSMPDSFHEHPSLKLLSLDDSQDVMVRRVRELIPKIMIAWWGETRPEIEI